MTGWRALPRLALGVAVAGAAIWLAFNRDSLDPEFIESAIGDLGLWAPLVHVIVFALATVVFLPGATFGLAGGALFGPLCHIPGAINVPLGKIDDRLDQLRGRQDGRVAIVCRTDRRSMEAHAKFRRAGFEDVAVLRGGMERWNKLGFAVDRDANDDPSLNPKWCLT